VECAVKLRSSKYPASKKGKSRNFDAFLKKIPPKNKWKKRLRRFSLCPYQKLNLVPTDMVLDNLAFKIDDNGNKTNINFQNYV
jgi:hypothetical protein